MDCNTTFRKKGKNAFCHEKYDFTLKNNIFSIEVYCILRWQLSGQWQAVNQLIITTLTQHLMEYITQYKRSFKNRKETILSEVAGLLADQSLQKLFSTWQTSYLLQ